MYLIAKRLFDIFSSLFGIIIISPILLVFIVLIFIQDFGNPFYVSDRVGKNNKLFKIIKLRSMILNADKVGVDSTSSDDIRITRVGSLVRKFKLDELTQLFNVLIGNMSLVGPRPNVQRDVDLYSKEELRILTIKPGITDFSSIIFSDEGDILRGSNDPDLLYNQIIRPWKSRLCILYLENRNLVLDIKLIFWTIKSFISKPKTLINIQAKLKLLTQDNQLLEICKREKDLLPYAPPGLTNIVSSRDFNS